LDNLQADLYRPEIAIECFDFSAGPASRGDRIQRGRDLLAVLDGQGKFVVYADVPGTPDYTDPNSGLARFVLFASLPEIRMEKLNGKWKVAASTVAAIPKLYERTYRIPIQRLAKRLPPSFSRSLLGVQLWKWLALILLGLSGMIAGRFLRFVLGNFLRRTARRYFESWDLEVETSILRWSAHLATAGLIIVLLPNLALPVRANQVLLLLLQLAACVSAVLVLHSVVDLMAAALARRAAETETTMDDALVPLVRRGAKLLVDVVGVLFILQNLDVDIGSLLATLGIGGLAFALAAKDTLANLFGFLTIVADRPFQIGDWVVVDGVEGTVEEVGIRSTRIRTFYDSVVTIPNSSVAGTQIDNLGRRRRRRLKMHLTVEYGTTSAQMKRLVDGVREVILESPKTYKDTCEVHFNQMSDSSLDVLVYCFIVTDSWSDELATRQVLMLAWMKVAEDLGIGFAYPTQTTHIASVPERLSLAAS
jgi:MscS family membrane protein